MTKKNQRIANKYVEALKENLLNNAHDREAIHSEADEILIQALIELGFGEIADAYIQCEEVGFWYA